MSFFNYISRAMLKQETKRRNYIELRVTNVLTSKIDDPSLAKAGAE